MFFSGTGKANAMKVSDDQAMQDVMLLLDEWQAPEVSPWFEGRMAARFREEQMRPPASFFARLRDRFELGNQAAMRPLMAGALALLLVAGGGGVWELQQQAHPAQQPGVSATIQDLQIMDTNAQTIQQMGQLLDDDSPQS